MPKNQPTHHFPTKLHELLDDAESKGHSNVISWCPDGKSFRIHDPRAMLPVLAHYFRQTKYKSLLRQLQGYSFKRVTSGEEKGNVSHPLFVRGERHLCMQMKRKQNSTKIPENASKANEPIKTSKGKSVIKPKRRTEKKSVAKVKRTTPVPPIAQSNGGDIQKLESNLRRNMKNSMTQSQTNQQMTTTFSAPTLVDEKQSDRFQRRPAGMEALRIEIGCTLSTSNMGNKKAKRMSSAPEFELGRLSKRQRSFEVGPMNRPIDASSTLTNASFPFSSMLGSEQPREDAIITEEKINFQKIHQEKQNRIEFDKLEKLCFSNNARQFQHSHHSTTPVGTLDLDISLTTTTTTTHQNGSSSAVTSSTVSNKFVLPSQLEPTPIISPKRGPAKSSINASDGFSLSCDIDFSTKDFLNKTGTIKKEGMDIFLTVPSGMLPQEKRIPECSSVGGDVSLGRSSEVSGEIDEGIAEAFEEYGNDDKWADVSFESDREEDEEDWTKGITYEGKSDCVLEPEKFQIEVQSLLSSDKHEQRLRLQKQQMPQHQVLVQQQPQAMYPQHQPRMNQIPRRMQFGELPINAMRQPQLQPFQNPYALLSKPMPFHQQNFPSTLQIQQITLFPP